MCYLVTVDHQGISSEMNVKDFNKCCILSATDETDGDVVEWQ